MPVSLPSRHRPRDITAALPHWSEVCGPHAWPSPSPLVAAALSDLVNWVADIGVKVTRRTTPEDHEAIERVRRYALAWLAGESCPDASMADLLTTTAAMVAAIDRKLLTEDEAPKEDGSPLSITVVWIA